MAHLKAINKIARPNVTRQRRPPYVSWAVILPAVLASPQALGAAAQLPSTNDEIKIDGVLEEAAWRSATRIKIDTETNPGENIPARVETVAYLSRTASACISRLMRVIPTPARFAPTCRIATRPGTMISLAWYWTHTTTNAVHSSSSRIRLACKWT